MMMKYIALLGVVLMLAGCASFYPAGGIYTEGKMGVQAGSGAADKTGRACMTSILALVATGDASIEAAKAAGGIKEVVSMNYEVKNILGVWGEYCLVVKGR
jgi:hypothetical protein